jgi:transposase
VAIRILADIKHVTIGPLIKETITPGAVVYTDKCDIYTRLPEWGYMHRTVCHAAEKFARDEDKFCEVHVNTVEGLRSLRQSWLCPHRGIAQDKLPLSPGFFEFVHNFRRRGEALIGLLIGPSPEIPDESPQISAGEPVV